MSENPPQHPIHQKQALRDIQISQVVEIDVLCHWLHSTHSNGHHAATSSHTGLKHGLHKVMHFMAAAVVELFLSSKMFAVDSQSHAGKLLRPTVSTMANQFQNLQISREKRQVFGRILYPAPCYAQSFGLVEDLTQMCDLKWDHVKLEISGSIFKYLQVSWSVQGSNVQKVLQRCCKKYQKMSFPTVARGQKSTSPPTPTFGNSPPSISLATSSSLTWPKWHHLTPKVTPQLEPATTYNFSAYLIHAKSSRDHLLKSLARRSAFPWVQESKQIQTLGQGKFHPSIPDHSPRLSWL